MDNVHNFQTYEQCQEEARQWVLEFNNDQSVSEEKIAALKAWASRSPAHRTALKEAEDFWIEAELLTELAVPLQKKSRRWLPDFCSQSLSLFSRREGSIRLHPTALAMGLVLVLVAVTLFTLSGLLPGSGKVGNGIYHTTVGEQRLLTLQDNSKIHLDTNSLIKINYHDNRRQLTLMQGKAHFSVSKDPGRPFEVFTSEGKVRAIGTAFSVYLDRGEVEVTVDEGRVELVPVRQSLPAAHSRRTPPRPIPLAQGQRATLNQPQPEVSELSQDELKKAMAWREGKLVFVRDPLANVVAEVSRYTDTTIEIVDPKLSQLIVGGRFRVGELDALLDVLEAGFGVQVSRLSPHHVQLRLTPND